jgi:ribose 5-phosphate isomerase B
VVAEPGTLGLLVCGTGIGISIAANKVAGARAARVTDVFSARMARAHNDANVVCLGARVTGVGLAIEVLRAFRDGRFEGGRHQRRIDKLAALDRGR